MDTLFVSIDQFPEYYLKQSFWDLHIGHIIGAFIGAFFAGLIAYLSIRKTYKIERKKEQNLYGGALMALYYELQNHNQISEQQRLELEAVRDRSIDQNRFIIEKSTSIFPTDFISQCLFKVLEYDHFNSYLINHIITYQGAVNNFNNSLNYSNAANVIKLLSDDDDITKGIKEYFNAILTALKKLDDGRPKILAEIKNELKRYPQFRIKEETNAA